MGFDIHILGTSSARPTGSRQVSGSLVVCDDGVAIVDAGEGFQSRFAVQRRRMKQFGDAQLKVGRVDVLCLTHGHLDHTWGVLPWLHTLSLDKREKPLLIIGPTSSQVQRPTSKPCRGRGRWRPRGRRPFRIRCRPAWPGFR